MRTQKIDVKKIWTVTLWIYIICSTAFSYGEWKMLNTYSLYLFLGVSALTMILKMKVKLDISIIPIMLYGLLLLVGMIYTPTSISKVQEIVYKYCTMMVIVLCVIQHIDSIEDVKGIMFAYMIAGLVLAIYVYSLYGSEFWTLMREATENEYGYVDRLGGELMNTNAIGLFTMVSALIAAYNVLFDRTSKIKTVICILVGIFCFIVSMSAASKKSVLLLLVACFCFWLYSSLGNRHLFKQLKYIFLLVASVLVLFWLLNTLPIFSGIASRMTSLLESSGGGGTVSEINRMKFIEQGITIWGENPILGAGTAASIYYFGVYTHNNIIEMLINTGLIGLCLFYAAYPVTAYKYLAYAKSYKDHNMVSVLLFALFVGVTICGFALVYYYERYFMILIAVVMTAIKIFDRARSSATMSFIERH